jgi:hypothetical protein
MFFLATVFPKLITKQATGMLCPSCGRDSLSQVRLDHVLSLFTLPALTVHTGRAWLFCSECGWSDKAVDIGQVTCPSVLRCTCLSLLHSPSLSSHACMHAPCCGRGCADLLAAVR